MNKELIARFLREFAHYEDAEAFVEEFPNNAAHLARSVYKALMEDTFVSNEFKEIMRKKWSGILNA